MVHVLTETPDAEHHEDAPASEHGEQEAIGRIAWLLAEARGPRDDPYRYVLVLRFAVGSPRLAQAWGSKWSCSRSATRTAPAR